MTNRKKRLRRGIDSVERQVRLHEEKLKRAQDEGFAELARYYQKEIEAKKSDVEKKKRLLEKGG